MRKNVTLTADETLIQLARERAQKEQTTLNALFRDWLCRYAERDRAGEGYSRLMSQLTYVAPGRRFDRDEMNER